MDIIDVGGVCRSSGSGLKPSSTDAVSDMRTLNGDTAGSARQGSGALSTLGEGDDVA